MYFGVCAHGSKITGKSLRTRFSSESRHRDLSKHMIFEFQNANILPEVSPGRLGRPPAAPLGPSWPPTWPPWRALGRSLAAWGPLLGALGSLLATLLLANSRNFVCQTGFSSFSAPFGGENLRNSAENLRNPGENLPAAPCLQRRTPTRVRRSREASSIRRTRRLRRERSVLNNAELLPHSSPNSGSLPPLTPPPASA